MGTKLIKKIEKRNTVMTFKKAPVHYIGSISIFTKTDLKF